MWGNSVFRVVSVIFTLQESKKPFYELMMRVTKRLDIGKHDLKAIKRGHKFVLRTACLLLTIH